jgi:hypothetical protein
LQQRFGTNTSRTGSSNFCSHPGDSDTYRTTDRSAHNCTSNSHINSDTCANNQPNFDTDGYSGTANTDVSSTNSGAN